MWWGRGKICTFNFHCFQSGPRGCYCGLQELLLDGKNGDTSTWRASGHSGAAERYRVTYDNGSCVPT